MVATALILALDYSVITTIGIQDHLATRNAAYVGRTLALRMHIGLRTWKAHR